MMGCRDERRVARSQCARRRRGHGDDDARLHLRAAATQEPATGPLDYDDSLVPGQIVATVMHLPHVTDRGDRELGFLLRWSYGSAFGLLHGELRRPVGEPWASAAFGATLITATLAFPCGPYAAAGRGRRTCWRPAWAPTPPTSRPSPRSTTRSAELPCSRSTLSRRSYRLAGDGNEARAPTPTSRLPSFASAAAVALGVPITTCGAGLRRRRLGQTERSLKVPTQEQEPWGGEVKLPPLASTDAQATRARRTHAGGRARSAEARVRAVGRADGRAGPAAGPMTELYHEGRAARRAKRR